VRDKDQRKRRCDCKIANGSQPVRGEDGDRDVGVLGEPQI